MERMENAKITKRFYVGESASSRSVGRPWKRLMIHGTDKVNQGKLFCVDEDGSTRKQFMFKN